MARVSIFYDNDKKEQFFMIRGDERYSRSTKTVLEKVSVDLDRFQYDCVMNVNVLRDISDGSIVIYNNEVPISVEVYDETTETYVESDSIHWESTFNGAKFKISSLAYDVDNNITAKYIGNKSSSPSLSNVVTVFEKDTNRTAAILTIDDTTQYNPNTTITKNIVLSNDLSPTYNEGQVFEVLYDGQLLGTTEPTNENGETSIEIPIGNSGLHTITVDYDESEHLLSKTVTQNISAGFNVKFTNPPKYIVQGNTYQITGLITDMFGEPYTPSSNKVILIVHTDVPPYMPEYSCTVENGVVSSSFPTSADSLVSAMELVYRDGNAEYSEIVRPTAIVPTEDSLSCSISQDTIIKDEQNILNVQVSPSYYDLPIELNGVVTETIKTNEQGIATKTLTGLGTGQKSITASLGNISKSVEYGDYIQYWSRPGSPKGRNYEIRQGELLDLANYYRLDKPTNYTQTFLALPINSLKNYALYVDGITSSHNIAFGLLVGNVGEPWSILGNGYRGKLTNSNLLIVKRDGTYKFTLLNGSGNYHIELNDNMNLIGFVIGNYNYSDNYNIQTSFTRLTLEEISDD